MNHKSEVISAHMRIERDIINKFKDWKNAKKHIILIFR